MYIEKDRKINIKRKKDTERYIYMIKIFQIYVNFEKDTS